MVDLTNVGNEKEVQEEEDVRREGKEVGGGGGGGGGQGGGGGGGGKGGGGARLISHAPVATMEQMVIEHPHTNPLLEGQVSE